jgi:hypothetical protein
LTDLIDKSIVDLEGDLSDRFISLESTIETNLNKFNSILSKETKEMAYNIQVIDNQLN